MNSCRRVQKATFFKSQNTAAVYDFCISNCVLGLFGIVFTLCSPDSLFCPILQQDNRFTRDTSVFLSTTHFFAFQPRRVYHQFLAHELLNSWRFIEFRVKERTMATAPISFARETYQGPFYLLLRDMDAFFCRGGSPNNTEVIVVRFCSSG